MNQVAPASLRGGRRRESRCSNCATSSWKKAASTVQIFPSWRGAHSTDALHGKAPEDVAGDEGDDPPKEVIGLFAVLAFFGFATATQSLFAAGILGVPQLPDFFGSGDLPDDLGL